MMYQMSTIIERLEKQATADEEYAGKLSSELEGSAEERERMRQVVRDRQLKFIDKLYELQSDDKLEEVYQELHGYGYRSALQPPKIDTEVEKNRDRFAGRAAAMRDIVTMLKSSGDEKVSTGELEKLGLLPYLKL